MPSTTREVNLYCKNGYLLQIGRKGEMSGTHRVKDNKFAVIKVSTVDHGVVTLQAATDGLYVAINNVGRVRTKKIFNEDCLFFEELDPANGYISYRAHRSGKRKYYLGISRRGNMRPANKILPDQNCAKFLHLNACDVPEETITEEGQFEREKIEKALASNIQMQEVSRKVGLTKSQKQEVRKEELEKRKSEQPDVAEIIIPSEKKRKKKKKKQSKGEALDENGQESNNKPEKKLKQKDVNQAKKRTNQSSDKDKEGMPESNEQTTKKQKPSETKEHTGKIQKHTEKKDTSVTAQQTRENEHKKKKQTTCKESNVSMKQQQSTDGSKHEVAATQSQIGKHDNNEETSVLDNKFIANEDKHTSDNVSNDDTACTSNSREQVDESLQQMHDESETENNTVVVPVKNQDHDPKRTVSQHDSGAVTIVDNTQQEIILSEADKQSALGETADKDETQSVVRKKEEKKSPGIEKKDQPENKDGKDMQATKANKSGHDGYCETHQKKGETDNTSTKKLEPKGKNQEPLEKKQEATEKEQEAIEKKQGASEKKQGASEKKQGASENKQAASKKKQEALGKKHEASKNKSNPSENKQKASEKKPEPSKNKEKATEKKTESSDNKEKVTEKTQEAPEKKQETQKPSSTKKDKQGPLGKKCDKLDPLDNKQDLSKTKQDKPEPSSVKQNKPEPSSTKQESSSTNQNKQEPPSTKQEKQDPSENKSYKQEAFEETPDKQEPLGGKEAPSDKKQEMLGSSNKKQMKQETKQDACKQETLVNNQEACKQEILDNKQDTGKPELSDNKQDTCKQEPLDDREEPSRKKQEKHEPSNKKQQPLNKKQAKQQSADKKQQDKQEPLENKQDIQEPLTKSPEQQQPSENTNEPSEKKQTKYDGKDADTKNQEDVSTGNSMMLSSQTRTSQTESEQNTSESPKTAKATNDEQQTKKNKKKKKQKTNNGQKQDTNAPATADKSIKLEDEHVPKQDNITNTEQAERQHVPTTVSNTSASDQHTAATSSSEVTTVTDPINLSNDIKEVNPTSTADSEQMTEGNEVVFSKQEILPEQSQQDQAQEVNNNQAVDIANPLQSSETVQESTPSGTECCYNETSNAEETQPQSPTFGADLESNTRSALAQSKLDSTSKNIPNPIPIWSDIVQQQPPQIDHQQVVIDSAEMTQQTGFIEQTLPCDTTNFSQDVSSQISMTSGQTETDSAPSWSDVVQQSTPVVNGSTATVAEQQSKDEQTSNNDRIQEVLIQSNLPTVQPNLESGISPSVVQQDNSSPSVELPIEVSEEITQNEPPTWSDIVQHSPQQAVQEQNTHVGIIQSEQQVPDQILPLIDLPRDQATSANINKTETTASVKDTVVHEHTLEAGQEPTQVTEKDKGQTDKVATFSNIFQQQSLQQLESKQEQGIEGSHGIKSLSSVPEPEPDVWEDFMRDEEETPVQTESDAWEEFMTSPSDQQEPDLVVPAQTEPDIWEDFMRDPGNNQDHTSTICTETEEMQDTNNNTAVNADLKLTEQPDRSQIREESISSTKEPPQDNSKELENIVVQPSETEGLKEPFPQTNPQDKVLYGAPGSLHPQSLQLAPSSPPETVLPGPSPVTAIPSPQAPTPDNTAMPYDHPWSADFNKQPPGNIPLASDPNIWEEYTGPAGVTTGVAQGHSDVWDKYMTPVGFMGSSSPDANTMFAHAFFKDDISLDQQQHEPASHQQITGQDSQQPGNARSKRQSVDSLQPQKQSQARQSPRSVEQLRQVTTQPELMQEPQKNYAAFSDNSLGQPVPSLHQGQTVGYNIGSSNSKQPDLVAGMGQMAPVDNVPLPLADPWVRRQDVPVASPTNRNTQGHVGTPAEEAFGSSAFDDLHID